MEIMIARECLYDRKRDCVIKTYFDVIAQLVDAIATRPFPFPAPKKKMVKGRRRQTSHPCAAQLERPE
jgi:hypothetical protein